MGMIMHLCRSLSWRTAASLVCSIQAAMGVVAAWQPQPRSIGTPCVFLLWLKPMACMDPLKAIATVALSTHLQAAHYLQRARATCILVRRAKPAPQVATQICTDRAAANPSRAAVGPQRTGPVALLAVVICIELQNLADHSSTSIGKLTVLCVALLVPGTLRWWARVASSRSTRPLTRRLALMWPGARSAQSHTT